MKNVKALCPKCGAPLEIDSRTDSWIDAETGNKCASYYGYCSKGEHGAFTWTEIFQTIAIEDLEETDDDGTCCEDDDFDF